MQEGCDLNERADARFFGDADYVDCDILVEMVEGDAVEDDNVFADETNADFLFPDFIIHGIVSVGETWQFGLDQFALKAAGYRAVGMLVDYFEDDFILEVLDFAMQDNGLNFHLSSLSPVSRRR